MAFYAQVSDPSVGGTYMTMLNTFTNLGGNWPTWCALQFVSELTYRKCEGVSQSIYCNDAEATKVIYLDHSSFRSLFLLNFIQFK